MNYGARHSDSVLISIRVPSSVAIRLKSDAKILDWSTSHLVRKILRLYCAGDVVSSVYDLAPGFRCSDPPGV